MKYKTFSAFLLFSVFISCQNRYYSPEDFYSVKKVDAHVHINSDKGYFEDIANDDNFVLITLNVDHSDTAGINSQLKYAVLAAGKHPGKVYYGSTFCFDTTGWGSEDWSRKVITYLDKTFHKGMVTVKIWKNIGMTVRDRSGKFIMVDDPGLDPVIKYIKSRNLPVTGHLGEPRNCWLPLEKMTVSSDSSYFANNPQYHMFLHPEYPTYEDQIKARDNLLRKNPDLKFIACHLGSLEWNVDSLAKRLDEFQNMVVDMSARICHLQYQSARDRKKVRDFCIKYQDRLLYGTDVGENGTRNPDDFKKEMHKIWIDDWKYFTTDDNMTSDKFKGSFKGLKLPKKVVDKIYLGNAVAWYKLNPD